MSDVHNVIQEDVISGSEYDTLTAIISKLDVLLKQCSGHEIVSASQMADQILDIRQFITKEKDKQN